MADHNKPAITSNYSDFVSELDARLDDISKGFDPAYSTPTNIPTNTIRFSSASNKWQKWDGSAWNDLTSTYGINVSSANTLSTARTINGVSFNGSANISVNCNNSVTFNNSGSGATSGSSFNGSSAVTISYNTIGAQAALGYTPVQQSGGTGQLGNKVYIGWLGTQLGLQVDTTNYGSNWPISITGNAGSVDWSNVNNRPTNVSSFTNDSNYITTNGRAYPRKADGSNLNINWSVQSGQPTGLFGSNNGIDVNAYNPSNFSVNYATTAGTADSVAWSGITNKPISAIFESSNQSYPTTTNQAYSVNHGLGAKPKWVRLVAVCLTANSGYSVGDETEVTINGVDNGNINISPWVNATQIGWTSGSQIVILNRSTGNNLGLINNANFALKVYAML